MGGFANNAPIVTDGLVFYVDAGNGNSYPGSGTTWGDLVGDNDGTFEPVAGPTYDSANGGSIVFDGADDYSISSYTGSTSYPVTLSCWVNLDSTAATQTFFSLSDASVADQFIGVAANATNFIIYNYGGSYNQALSSSTPSAGTWYNVVGVFESTTIKKLYVNGVSEAILTATTSFPTGVDTATVARFTRGGAGTSGGYTDGKISCASIHNKALTANEITQNYNALKNRFV